jgi:hypothetical protein
VQRKNALIAIVTLSATLLVSFGCSDSDSDGSGDQNSSSQGGDNPNSQYCGTSYEDAMLCGNGGSVVSGIPCPNLGADCVVGAVAGLCYPGLTFCDPGSAVYIFDTPKEFLSEGDYQTIATALTTTPNAQLWADPTGCGYSSITGSDPSCIGWAATSSCEMTRIDQFVTDFLAKGGAPAACAVVTATIAHESGFGEAARSWDFDCPTTGAMKGAVGLFQYDFTSGIRPLPASADAQHAEFANGGSGAPSGTFPLTKWAACNSGIADGGTPFTSSNYSRALTACQAQTTETELAMSNACRSYCPDNQNCPNP